MISPQNFAVVSRTVYRFYWLLVNSRNRELCIEGKVKNNPQVLCSKI